MNDEPNRIFIGSFDGGVNTVVIPNQVIERANAKLDAERRKREAAAAKAKMEVLQDARSRGRLKKAFKLILRRRGR
jgi:hypothetical protein